MIRTDKRLRLCTALLICNLVFIWGNSLLPGEISGAISDWVKMVLKAVLELFLPDLEDGLLGGGLLRKAAHFTEFAALGALLGWRFGMLGKGKILPFFWGAAAACIDETIQVFVPGRGPSIKDVCIDSSGVLTGMVLLYLGHTYFCKKHRM